MTKKIYYSFLYVLIMIYIQPLYANTEVIESRESNHSRGNKVDAVIFKNENKAKPTVRAESLELEKLKEEEYDKNNLLNIQHPVFFVSEGSNTKNYQTTIDLCSFVNVYSILDCIVYPVEKKEDIPKYIRRGQESDKYDQTGYSADFLIVRADVLKQYQGSQGYLKDSPPLDLIMFLNGEYFFMFANKSKNLFSIEQLVSMKRNIRVGYLNSASRVLFERAVKEHINIPNVSYIEINTGNVKDMRKAICTPNNIDIFIYFNNQFTNDIRDVMHSCAAQINPITFSEETQKKILESNELFSGSNVINYYQSSSVINYLENFVAVEKRYNHYMENDDLRQEAISNMQRQRQIQNQEQEQEAQLEPEEEARRNREALFVTPTRSLSEDGEQVLQRNVQQSTESRSQRRERERAEKEKIKQQLTSQERAFEENKKNIYGNYIKNDKLIFRQINIDKVAGNKNEQVINKQEGEQLSQLAERVYISNNSSIRSFGIRNVLVASRYTKKNNIFSLFDAIIKDYFANRNDLLTADMSKYSIRDIILGTALKHNFNYNPFLAQYPRYMLEQKVNRTTEQNLAIRNLNNSLYDVSYPPFAGPPSPTRKQLDKIYQKVRDLDQKKEELIVIKNFQRDLDNIYSALKNLKDGTEIVDSLIKTTNLADLNVIFDETNILDVDIDVEQNPDEAPKVVEDYEGEVDPDAEYLGEFEGDQSLGEEQNTNPEELSQMQITTN